MAGTPRLGAILRTVARLKDWAGARRRKESTLRVREQEQQQRILVRAMVDRQARAERVYAEHKHVMEVAAYHLDLAPESLEEGLLDAYSHVDLLDSFLEAGGRNLVIFTTTDLASLSSESGRSVPEPSKGLRRVVVVDGNDLAIDDGVVVVFRIKNDQAINMKLILEDVYFKSFDMHEGDSCLSFVDLITSLVTKPRLEVNTEWGMLQKIASGMAIEGFLNSFNDFTLFLDATQKNLEEIVTLDFPDLIFRKYLIRPDRIVLALTDQTIVREVEETVRKWYNQITYALVRTSRMRQDGDDAGPHLELDHWRFVSAVLASIVEQIKSNECKSFIRFLILSRSKLFQKWKALDNRITSAYNEALDNVKFLYSLETLYLPLYVSEPPEIQKSVKVLMFGIRMMYTTSLYYNTREKITSFLTKVTTRMVATCRAYLTKDGDIWKQAKSDVIKKINECMALHKTYYESFRNTKREMAEAVHEKPFDCSETFIFKVFEAFNERLEQIADVLSIILNYSLLETCAIENMDKFIVKFKRIFKKISSKPYNILDYSEPKFTTDYVDFKNNVADIEDQLQLFLVQCLRVEAGVVNALELLQRFENLNLPCFKIQKMYPPIVEAFEIEIARWRDFYDEHCPKPHLHKMPQISGRIYWARSIFKRIDKPMMLLKVGNIY